jgi:hypothetical protein
MWLSWIGLLIILGEVGIAIVVYQVFGNAEGVGLGNRFAQKVDQRIVDARVF